VRIYLAGPLSTPPERAFVEECAAALRAAGHEVFVPHEQFAGDELEDLTPAHVFAVDAAGVRSADALVAILDGPSIDDGTACEIGLFYGLMQGDPSKRGMVALLTDLRAARRGEHGGLNLFVLGCIEASGGRVCASIDEVVAALAR
jgi:nucleoside 2-deoxyribosyltransferase